MVGVCTEPVTAQVMTTLRAGFAISVLSSRSADRGRAATTSSASPRIETISPISSRVTISGGATMM